MARRSEKPAPKSDAAKVAADHPSSAIAPRERPKPPAGRSYTKPVTASMTEQPAVKDYLGCLADGCVVRHSAKSDIREERQGGGARVTGDIPVPATPDPLER
jgi:hypothetical protein